MHTFLAIRKLEFSLLKYYLVTAITNNKIDKVTEFFVKLASDLQTQAEWKDWFGNYIYIFIYITRLILYLSLQFYHT